MMEPTLDDINEVFKNNSVAVQQLQIVTLTRIVKEQDEEINDLKKQLEDKEDPKKKT